ncbi:MAG: helix-turn-helix domain-containing protein [Thermodesulfobacteriota bacterium]
MPYLPKKIIAIPFQLSSQVGRLVCFSLVLVGLLDFADRICRRLVGLLDSLIDKVGNDESHPLSSLMETIGSLIETYESQNVPDVEGDPVETLKSLMEEHGLKQTDLPEVGSQGVVSEILSGKRQLNVRQIKLLSQRFGVSPSVFI